MITTCTGCHTRYRLDDAKVPRRLIQVRCPGCQSIFMLDGTGAAHVDQAGGTLDLETPTDGFQFDKSPLDSETPLAGAAMQTGAGSLDTSVTGPAPEFSVQPEATPSIEAPATAEVSPQLGNVMASVVPPERVTATAVEETPVPQRRRTRDKTAMLARALVSDILVYNRNARDKALAEGNLLEVLGPEIKKSWELYKEKVTPEIANNTTHFRDALNDILAGGQKVF